MLLFLRPEPTKKKRSLTLYFIVPGIHVSVVNSYAAASLLVPVSVVRSVLFPTDGNPTIDYDEKKII